MFSNQSKEKRVEIITKEEFMEGIKKLYSGMNYKHDKKESQLNPHIGPIKLVFKK